MTTIKKFRVYLKDVAILSLIRAEKDFRNIPVNQLTINRKWVGFKLSLVHFLNTLYLEMEAFKIGIESEIKRSRLKAGKVLVEDLQKDMELISTLRKEVWTTGDSFTNRELFVSMQQKLLPQIISLRKALEDYVGDLHTFEQGLLMRFINRIRPKN